MQLSAITSRRKRDRSLLWTERRDALLFILPWFIGFVVFTAGPMLASLYMSFTRWEIVTTAGLGGIRPVSEALLATTASTCALWNTAYYVFLGVPLHLFLALLAALAMNLNVKGIRIFRTLYYVPSLTPTVANAILWMWIFHPQWGLANAVLERLGLPRLYWLQDPKLAKPAFIIMSFWTIGAQMVILLAGLKGIPQTLYEAADIDGANVWHSLSPRDAAPADARPLLQPDHRHHRRIPGLHPGLYYYPGRAATTPRSSTCSISTAWRLRTSAWAMRRRWPGFSLLSS